jgi:predicted Zn finger-like uncharacterized protein
MKVVCDACHAKYQVPDERVAGRKLKIRCRKCNAAIIVQGDAAADNIALAPVSEPPSAFVDGDNEPTHAVGEAEWHVSLDGEQHGPYPTSQMASMLRGSQLDWDVYVWRESYGDWKAASDSETLVRAVAAAVEEEPTAAIAAPVEPPSPFDDENDPTRMAQSHGAEALLPLARTSFAARAASRSQPPDGSLPRAPSQPPLTSSYVPRAASQPPTVSASYARAPSYAAESAYSGGYEAAPAYPAYASPRAAAHELTGERHEDSVLFAAQNLSLSASAAPAPSSSRSGGYASGEGSGLIDIRALAALARSNQAAQATNGHGNGAAAYTNGNGSNGTSHGGTNGNGRSSDLLVLANQTGAFSHLDSLAPIDRPSQASSKAVPLAILGGAMMVAAAVFAAILVTRGEPQPVTAAATVGAPAVAPVAEPAAVPAAAPAAVAAPEPAAAAPAAAPEPEPAAAPAPAVAAREPAERSPSSSKRAVSAKAAAGRAAQAAAAPPAQSAKAESKKDKAPSIDDLVAAEKKPKAEAEAEPAPAPSKSIDDDLLAAPAPAKPARSPSIDELLDSAVEPKAKNAAPAAAAAAALPETPTRDQVAAAMRAVAPAVLACGEGQTLDSNQAQVAVTVAGATGRVSSARVTGVQGPVGSCVARAVREAEFPKFAKSSLSINFPFKLK